LVELPFLAVEIDTHGGRGAHGRDQLRAGSFLASARRVDQPELPHLQRVMSGEDGDDFREPGMPRACNSEVGNQELFP